MSFGYQNPFTSVSCLGGMEASKYKYHLEHILRVSTSFPIPHFLKLLSDILSVCWERGTGMFVSCPCFSYIALRIHARCLRGSLGLRNALVNSACCVCSFFGDWTAARRDVVAHSAQIARRCAED
jgi:hypothetical protein